MHFSRRCTVVIFALTLVATSCTGETEETPGDPPTYFPTVATLLNNNCVSCHATGSIAPFPLDTYAHAKANKDMIVAAVESRRMPPSPVDVSGDCNTYKEAMYLTDDEIKTIVRWADTGALEGNSADAPVDRAVLPSLTNPSVTVTMAEPYTPDATLGDDYRCFVLDPALTEDQFLTGIEVTPGDTRVVHHALVFAVADAESDAEAIALEAAEAEPGFTCFGDAGVDARLLNVWAPGTGFTSYPEGTGIKIKAGRKLVLQVHYNTLSGTFPDQTTVKLRLVPNVTVEAYIDFVLDDDMVLPAGNAAATWSFDNTVPSSLRVYGVFPHMHTLGRNMKLERIVGDDVQCVADVPRWDFHWQRFYFFDKPVGYDFGDVTRVSCEFDTRSRAEQVSFGEGTQDEMCLFGVYYTAD